MRVRRAASGSIAGRGGRMGSFVQIRGAGSGGAASAEGLAREIVRAFRGVGHGRGQDQAGGLGLAVGEEGAVRALGGHAGGAGVADRGAEREAVAGLLEVAAVVAVDRDRGQHAGLGAVGADLLPHRHGECGDQLVLGRVGRCQVAAQVGQVLGPLGRVLLGQQAEIARAQAVPERVPGRARLALGRAGAALARRRRAWPGRVRSWRRVRAVGEPGQCSR